MRTVPLCHYNLHCGQRWYCISRRTPRITAAASISLLFKPRQNRRHFWDHRRGAEIGGALNLNTHIQGFSVTGLQLILTCVIINKEHIWPRYSSMTAQAAEVCNRSEENDGSCHSHEHAQLCTSILDLMMVQQHLAVAAHSNY